MDVEAWNDKGHVWVILLNFRSTSELEWWYCGGCGSCGSDTDNVMDAVSMVKPSGTPGSKSAWDDVAFPN